MIKNPTKVEGNCSSNIRPSLSFFYWDNFWIVDKPHPEQFLGLSTNMNQNKFWVFRQTEKLLQ